MALELVTTGESHGREILAVLLGLPAGLRLDRDGIDRELARRQHGHGRGGRQKIEHDRAEVRAGLRDGVTLGSPLAIAVPNRDWDNWSKVMDPWGVDPAAAAKRRPTAPRPGHADLAGAWKYGHGEDLRNVLERASARETAARVAAGAVCKQLLARCGCEIRSGVLALGGVTLREGPPSFADLLQVDDGSPLRTVAPGCEDELVALVDRAKHAGETLGGVLGVVARGVPPGLGSYARWEDRLDGQLAQAIMAIQAIKAVAIGAGFETAGLPGSRSHDPILPGRRGLRRGSNHAGGIEGGVSNGQEVVVRAYMKPIATLREALPSVDLATGKAARAAYERSDVTAVPACGVIAEAALAFVLARALLAKFGGDHVEDTLAAIAAYRRRLGKLAPEGFVAP
ncbi:MAG TPA: chorismate synthase [Thermoanaerobaculaceae bacterium]|nr:MAG: chorismate synthase [Acidobacteria bacterium 37-71-11]HQU32940.1 chorismate synthase [Thermoanaerobaculaceae bacterium]